MPVPTSDRILRTLLVLALLVGCASHAAAAERSRVYVSVAGEQRIAVFERKLETGQLTPAGSHTTPGEPGALVVDRNRRWLFAAMRSTGDLTSFRIDPETGALTAVSRVAGGPDPAYVALDRTNRWLLTAYYVAGKVTVHRIGDDGSLSDRPHQTVPTDDKAHAIETDPANRFALVPHTGPNAIFQFRFDGDSGRLTANTPAKLQLEPNTGPRHIAWHPRLPVAFADNEQGSSVTAFDFDTQQGTLTPRQTLSTLPDDFTGNNSCAHLELSPDGRWLYAANRGHDSLAAYAVDPSTGNLRRIGIFPTEPTPRSFHIAPDGRHLYAAGQSSGKLAAYRLSAADGTLERFQTLPAGDRAWWVLVVDWPR